MPGTVDGALHFYYNILVEIITALLTSSSIGACRGPLGALQNLSRELRDNEGAGSAGEFVHLHVSLSRVVRTQQRAARAICGSSKHAIRYREFRIDRQTACVSVHVELTRRHLLCINQS